MLLYTDLQPGQIGSPRIVLIFPISEDIRVRAPYIRSVLTRSYVEKAPSPMSDIQYTRPTADSAMPEALPAKMPHIRFPSHFSREMLFTSTIRETAFRRLKIELPVPFVQKREHGNNGGGMTEGFVADTKFACRSAFVV